MFTGFTFDYRIVPLSINISFLVIASSETRHKGKGKCCAESKGACLEGHSHIIFATIESKPTSTLHLTTSLTLIKQPPFPSIPPNPTPKTLPQPHAPAPRLATASLH